MTESEIAEMLPGAGGNARLFGHEAAQRFLQRQAGGGQMHHALLFEGPEGIGKATLAFHFAYHILAGHNAADTAAEFWRHPDINSPLWRRMGQGVESGLLYISRGRDPKSQILRNAVTVDDVRRVSRFLQQTAADKGRRIVIIDSADDMNRNAANALLKTLEEPPAKTLFILISHNIGRLLPTIRSRCQWIRFKPLPKADMRRVLAHLADSSNSPDKTAISKELPDLAEGSVRRALILQTGNGADMVANTETVLKSAIFPAPQAQALADNLSKRDNAAVYALFLQFVLDIIHRHALRAAQAGNAAQAAALAEFFNSQEQAMRETQAYNLDKKQFILVLLQQTHGFLRANGAKAA